MTYILGFHYRKIETFFIPGLLLKRTSLLLLLLPTKMPSRKKLTVNVITSYEQEQPQPQVSVSTQAIVEQTQKKRVTKKKIETHGSTPIETITEPIATEQTQPVVVSTPEVVETIVETKKKRVTKKKQVDTAVSEPVSESVVGSVVGSVVVSTSESLDDVIHPHNTLEQNDHDNDYDDNDFVDIIVESISINQLSFFIDQNNILYHYISLLPIASFHDNIILYF